MTTRDRTYVFRWGLLVLIIAGWSLLATVVDIQHSRSAPVAVERPDQPRPPLVVPKTVLLPAASIDFSTALSVSASPLQTPPPIEPSPLRPPPKDGRAVTDGTVRDTSAAPDDELARADSLIDPPSSSLASHAGPPASSETPAAQRTTLPPATRAPQQSPATSVPRPPPTASVGLGGLVVDETMTPHGRSFYSGFYGVWRPPPTNGFYTIRVQEDPTPGRGTLVQVFVNDDVTFQARLQPHTNIDEQALQAARRTYAYVRSGQGILRIY